MSFVSLPAIVVTAKTKTAAVELISEIIDNDATYEVKPKEHDSSDRVWRLVNKYYTALVRVHARAEHDEPPTARLGPVGAHVVHLAADELEWSAAERRVEAAVRVCGPASVSVLACGAAAVPEALAQPCARRRLLAVALRGGEGEGVPAVRDALHAHTWPGLTRRDPGPQQEAQSVEAAERFAAALGALGGGAAHARSLTGAARLLAAEQLVAAFADAIPDMDL